MPPRGGIKFRDKSGNSHVLVSSHAPARGHQLSIRPAFCAPVFQVMPPRGGIFADFTKIKRANSFKSCPREGASRSRIRCHNAIKSFKSCPREGASCSLASSLLLLLVSSHAPARGHPIFRWTTQARTSRFKSCPREGASASFLYRRTGNMCFKSCPREGASQIRSYQ